jgi:hypothetical protein
MSVASSKVEVITEYGRYRNREREMQMEATSFSIELDNSSDEFDWEDARMALDDIFEASDMTHFRINGEGMGWTRVSGYKVVPYDKVAEALFLDGDFRIVFTFLDGILTKAPVKAVRYSHDEPVGASFTIVAASEFDIEDFGIED